MDETFRTFGQVLLSVLVIGVVMAVIMLALVWRKLRRVKVPPGADFFTTIRHVPLGLVVALDLLDFGLDFLSTPIDWLILSRFNLTALRNVAVVEALVPFTQPIPTLTLAWIAARALNLGNAPHVTDRTVIDTEEVEPGRYSPRKGGFQ